MKAPSRDDYIHSTTLSSEDWSGETLSEVEFSDVTFTGCDLSNTVLFDCSFDGCRFVGCNLEMAKVAGTNFSQVIFEKCRLRGIQWENVGLSFHDINFVDSALDYSSFLGRRLDELVTFSGCSLKDVGFESASLKKSKLTSCDLADARFTDALLYQTDFSGSKNYSIDISSSNVKRAIFTLPEALQLFEQFNIEIR